MTRIISFHRKQPKQLRNKIVLVSYESLRLVGLVVIVLALIWVAGKFYQPL